MKIFSSISGLLLLVFQTLWVPATYAQIENPKISVDTLIANAENRSIDIVIQVMDGDTPFEKLEGSDIEVLQDGKPLTVININKQETSAGIYKLQARSAQMFYTGETHKIRVQWASESSVADSKAFAPGSLVAPFPTPDQFSWLDMMVIGLLIVSVFLLILSEGTSLYSRVLFRMKYVKKYREVKMPKVTKHDPLTDDPFRDDELVVVRCRTMTSLNTWKFQNHQCMNYPDCMHKANPCQDGENSTGYEKFFSQKGIYKKLNWLWLGSLGGVIAGIIWTATRGIISGVLSQSIFGFMLGFTLATSLAYAEERGQGRAFSWMRVGLRGITGAAVGLALFSLGGFFASGIGGGYVFQLLIWLFFGTALGYVLSLNSSILAVRGLLAGLAGSFVGFNIYYFLLLQFQNDSLAIVISLICFGAIMALIMVTVINRLEDFELEILSPPNFRQRIIPISKWLKLQYDIFIGSDQDNRVWVKWNDEVVLPEHAQLSYDKTNVYIEPFGETLLNGRRIPLHKKTCLKDGDVVQLGRDSVSRMQYREKSVKR